MTSEPYTLRPAVPADDAPLLAMHEACFRPLVEGRFAWVPELQAERFAEGSRDGESWVVLVAGEVAGQLVVDDRGHELFVVRVMVHPRYQCRGIGGSLVSGVLERAAARGLPVTLSVWDTNRALQLYQRLGFELTGQVEFRVKMRWVSRRPSE